MIPQEMQGVMDESGAEKGQAGLTEPLALLGFGPIPLSSNHIQFKQSLGSTQSSREAEETVGEWIQQRATASVDF